MDRGWACAVIDPRGPGLQVNILENIFDLGINGENSRLTIRIDGKAEPLTPEGFLWIVPMGRPEGYH